MTLVLSILYFVLWIYSLLVLGRIVLEMIQSFSPQWRPRGPMALVAEIFYTPTDPPLRWLRSVIPPIPLGGIRLDLSPLILLLAIGLLMRVITALA